jgi:uncharacterized repeat protein (TIGR01451 family)
MAKRTREAIGFAALLAFLLLIGGLALWSEASLAGKPVSRIGPALRARLMGLVNGLWVGQVDPRAYAMPGEEIEYWLYYENNGPAVSEAKLVDILPFGCTFRVDSVDANPQCTWQYDPLNRRLEFVLGDLGPRKGGTVRFRVLVQADVAARTPLVNRAQTWVGNSMTDESVSEPTIVQAPQIEVSLEGPEVVALCRDAAYTLTYSNTGNIGAVSVTVALNLPDGFSFVRSSSRYPPAEISDKAITWDRPSELPVDGRETFTIYLRTSPKGAIWPGLHITLPVTVSTRLPSGPIRESHAEAAMRIESGPCPIYLTMVLLYPGETRDAYEPDSTPEQATIIEVDGEPTAHNFHRPGDEDWMRFYALPYEMYLVETYDLLGAEPPSGELPADWEPRTDTIMSAYEPRIDPLSPYITGTLICESDNRRDNPPDYASSCCFQATTRGWYFIRIRQHNPQMWLGTGYKVRVKRVQRCP